MNLRGRNVNRRVEEFTAKLKRRFVEYGDFLGRLDGHAFGVFSRLRRNEDSFL